MKKLLIIIIFLLSFVSFTNAQTFKSTVTINPEMTWLQMTAPVEIDYRLNVDQLISWSKPNQPSFIGIENGVQASDFKVTSKDTTIKTDAVLINIKPIHPYSVKDIKEEMEKNGLRPATIIELLQFGIQYPAFVQTINTISLDQGVGNKYPMIGAETTNNLWTFMLDLDKYEHWYLAMKK